MHCCERLPAQDRTGCDRPPSSFCRGSAKTRTAWCRMAARTASGSAGVGLRASGWRGVFGVKGERSLECSGDDALTQALSGQFPGRWPSGDPAQQAASLYRCWTERPTPLDWSPLYASVLHSVQSVWPIRLLTSRLYQSAKEKRRVFREQRGGEKQGLVGIMRKAQFAVGVPVHPRPPQAERGFGEWCWIRMGGCGGGSLLLHRRDNQACHR